jgi:hypothetical protein
MYDNRINRLSRIPGLRFSLMANDCPNEYRVQSYRKNLPVQRTYPVRMG